MRKRLIAAALAVLISAGFAATQAVAQEGQETSGANLIYSCDTGRGTTGNFGGVGTPLKQDYDVATRIDGKLFKGLYIEAIRVPMGEMENLSGLKVWLTKELALKTIDGKKTNAADIVTEAAEATDEGEGGWWEVQLAEPYQLTGEDIYAGYSFNMDALDDTNKRPVKITTELHDGGCFVHTSRSYRNWTDVSDMCSSIMEIVLSGAPQNAAAVSAEGAYFGAVGKKTLVTFLVENHGAAGISNIDYTYEYDGKTLAGHTDLVYPVSSVYNAASYFSFSLPEVTAKAYYPLNLTITKVNGGENNDAGRSLTQDVSIFEVVPKHLSVMEEYTGTWCGYCPRGIVGLEVMHRLYPEDFIALSYHEGDPMEVLTAEYYPNTISGFPAAYLDRQYAVDAYGGVSGSTSFGMDKAWLAACDMAAEGGVDVRAWLNSDKSAVEISAGAMFPLAVNKAKYAVELVLVADSLCGTTVNWYQRNYFTEGRQGTFPEPEFEKFTSGEEYVTDIKFSDVVVATTRLLNGLTYLPEQVEADKRYEADATIPFSRVVNTSLDPVVQNKKNLRVVALLINTGTGAVVNAAQTKVYEDESAGIGTVTVKPQSAGAVSVYDLSGRRTGSLQRGVNIVRTADGRTQKILVK